jgi:AraC-like DNA-binding protein
MLSRSYMSIAVPSRVADRARCASDLEPPVVRQVAAIVRPHAVQRYRGTTPMDHIRARRLERVHDELLAADPLATSVTDVAMRWGFGHLGKFAQAYRRRFDERPSETLRRLR